jgi:two-component system chemotaxis response regulator CheB
VLTLDIEMPRMDGLEFLEKLMRLRPIPVVMVSSLTGAGADATLRALELGAIDFVSKPKLGIEQGLLDYAHELADKIRTAAKARMPARPTSGTSPPKLAPRLSISSTEKLIMIGASTGGTEAIREMLAAMPADSPGILITQHMPPGFTKSFADRLDKVCRISVKEAEHGERVLPGHAYIAPGNRHLMLVKNGANYQTALSDDPPVNRHRPSVEVLFRSAAKVAGPSLVGVMLTGMGKDGAVAMHEMRLAGAYNFAQDEASCVVFGMPREAINAGAVHEVLPLSAMTPHIMAHLARDGPRTNRV